MAIEQTPPDSEVVESIVDRQAALLTKRQREIFIREHLPEEELINRGLVEPDSELASRDDIEEDSVVSKAVVRNRRKDARDRLFNSVLDMNILNAQLSPTDYRNLLRKILESDEIKQEGWHRGEQALAEFLYTISGIGSIEEIIANAIVNVEHQRANYLVNSEDGSETYPFDVEFDIVAEVTFHLEGSEMTFSEIEEKYEDESQELTATEKQIYDTFYRLREGNGEIDE